MKNVKSEHHDFFATKDFNKLLSHVVAHELSHAILDTNSKNGFDEGEHVEDPDPADGPNGPKDQKYLMRSKMNSANVDIIVFSKGTINQIDLTQKESVERNIYTD